MLIEQKNVKDRIVDDEALNVASVTSEEIRCHGYNQLTLFFNLSRSTLTKIEMKLQVYNAAEGVWGYRDAGKATHPYMDMEPQIWRRTISAGDNWEWNIPINCDRARIVITPTGGAALDTLSVRARLGVI